MKPSYFSYTFDRTALILLAVGTGPSLLAACVCWLLQWKPYVYSYLVIVGTVLVFHVVTCFFLWRKYRARHITEPRYKF